MTDSTSGTVNGAPVVKRATRTLKLYVGGDWDAVDEYHRIEERRKNPTSLAGLSGEDRARLDELAALIAAETMTFRLRALGRRSFQKLLDEHPPREGKNRDQVLGFDEDAATAALIRRCMVEPDLSDKALDELLDEDLVDGQYQELSDAVWTLNRRSVQIPLSLTASTPIRSSEDA